MSDIYRSIIVITTLKKNEKKNALVLNLPFRTYGENIVMLGKDITYKLSDMSNLGKQVMAKVDYRLEDMSGHSSVKGEALVAENFAGNLGQDYDTLKTDPRYTKHYNVKKADKFATFDENGTKIPYTGIDANDVAKFVEWDVDTI